MYVFLFFCFVWCKLSGSQTGAGKKVIGDMTGGTRREAVVWWRDVLALIPSSNKWKRMDEIAIHRRVMCSQTRAACWGGMSRAAVCGTERGVDGKT